MPPESGGCTCNHEECSMIVLLESLDVENQKPGFCALQSVVGMIVEAKNQTLSRGCRTLGVTK